MTSREPLFTSPSPGSAPGGAVRRTASRTINVCFHGIGEPGRTLEDGEAPYWISHTQFLSILDAISGHPQVRISFDDGNDSDHTLALPALLERGLTGSFFVLAGRIDSRGSLSTSQIRELQGAGMGIGSHGMDHRPWRGMNTEERHRELVEARDTLSDLLGTAIAEAALPLGRYDRETLSHLKRLGYTRVFSSDRRWARPDSWLQPRFSAHHDETLDMWRQAVLVRQSPARRFRQAGVGALKRLR